MAAIGMKLKTLSRLPEVAEKLEPDFKPEQASAKKQKRIRLGKRRWQRKQSAKSIHRAPNQDTTPSVRGQTTIDFSEICVSQFPGGVSNNPTSQLAISRIFN